MISLMKILVKYLEELIEKQYDNQFWVDKHELGQ